jgi:hypothetical protein
MRERAPSAPETYAYRAGTEERRSQQRRRGPDVAASSLSDGSQQTRKIIGPGKSAEP